MDKCFESFASESFRISVNDFFQIMKACSKNLEKDPTIPCNTCPVSQRIIPTCDHCLCNPPIIPKSYDLLQQNITYPFQNHSYSLRGNNTSHIIAKGNDTSTVCHNGGCSKDLHLNCSSRAASSEQVSTSELFSWCPVEVDMDGGCSIAGLYRTKLSSLPCAFTITARVTSVSDNGRCVATEDGRTHYLHGGISWPVYNAVTLDKTIDTIPSSIANAFSSGFPAQNWRTWTQGLFYHITGFNEGKDGCLSSLPVYSGTSKVISGKYSAVPTSPMQLMDLDESIPCVTDIQSDSHSDHEDSKTASTKSQALFTVAPSGLLKGSREAQQSKSLPRLSPRIKSRLPANRLSATPSRRRPDHQEPIGTPKQTSGRHREKLSAQRGHSHKHSRVGKRNSVDDHYKLYTASGQVIDARKLPLTRSGRLVIPTLDSRFGHKLKIDRNRIVSVKHDFDDTASWILRRRNE